MSIAKSNVAVPADANKRRHWIAYNLKLRGLTLSAFAETLGVKRQAVSSALVAPSSERVDVALAEQLEIRVQDLFPERYDDIGERLYGRRANRLRGVAGT